MTDIPEVTVPDDEGVDAHGESWPHARRQGSEALEKKQK